MRECTNISCLVLSTSFSSNGYVTQDIMYKLYLQETIVKILSGDGLKTGYFKYSVAILKEAR